MSSPMFDAIERGDVLALQMALSKDAGDANATNSDGVPLIVACIKADKCEGEHAKMLEALLQHGAEVDGVDGEGNSALLAAASLYNVPAIETLLGKSASIELQNEDGETALIKSCQLNHNWWRAEEGADPVAVPRLLVERGHADVDAVDNDGNTALMTLAGYGCKEHDAESTAIAEYLIEAGADVDVINSDGDTTLIRAIYHGGLGLATTLVAKGASIETRGDDAHTPLYWACSKAHYSLIHLLLDKGAPINETNTGTGETALHGAADEGHAAAIAILAERGANLNALSGYGETALHMASTYGNEEAVEMLLAKGANVNLIPAELPPMGTQQRSALMAACAEGQRKIIDILVEHGAKLDLEDEDGRTALTLACVEGNIDAAFALLRHGADISDAYIDDNGESISVLDQLNKGSRAAQVKAVVELEVEEIGYALSSGFLTNDSVPAVLHFVLRLAYAAFLAARKERSRDTSKADDLAALCVSLQLACGGLLAALGEDDDDDDDDSEVMQMMRCRKGQTLLEYATSSGSLKVFVSQPLVQASFRRQWHGKWLHGLLNPDTEEEDFSWLWHCASWLGFLTAMCVHVSILPLFAIVPPILTPVKNLIAWVKSGFEPTDSYDFSYAREEVGKYFLFDDSPVLKFTVAYATDVTTVVLLTLMASGSLNEADPYLSMAILFACASTLVSEGRALCEDGLRAYLADFFNAADVTSNLLAIGALTSRMVESFDADGKIVLVQDYGPTSRTLLAFSTLFMWLRLSHVLQLSSTTGPFVLMVFKMVKDVFVWIVIFAFVLLGFAAALISLFSGSPPASYEAADMGECINPDEDFSTWGNAIMLLWEGGLTGDAYLECVRGSSSPVAAAAVMYLFQLLVGLLMVNMLIAMMAKTFDNVAEAQEINYMFLFSQTANEWRKQPRAPPALMLLSTPWALLLLLVRLFKLCCGEAMHTVIVKLEGGESSLHAKDDDYSLGSSWKETHKLSGVGESVTEFISGHQDDVPQEDRWRTIFARKMTTNFEEMRREREKESEELSERMQAMERCMDAIVTKLGVKVERPRRLGGGKGKDKDKDKDKDKGGRGRAPTEDGGGRARAPTREGLGVRPRDLTKEGGQARASHQVRESRAESKAAPPASAPAAAPAAEEKRGKKEGKREEEASEISATAAEGVGGQSDRRSDGRPAPPGRRGVSALLPRRKAPTTDPIPNPRSSTTDDPTDEPMRMSEHSYGGSI